MATLSVTATPRTDLSVPAVEVKATASGTLSTTVLRIYPDGSSAPVRTYDGEPAQFSGGALTVWDFDAPYGTPVTYRADGVTSSPVTLDVTVPWLIHPARPELSVPVHFWELGPRTRAADEGVFHIIGRRHPIVIGGGQRKAAAGSAVLRTDLDVDRVAMDALLDDGAPLLLNVPAGHEWGVHTEWWSVSTVTEARVVEYAPEPMRTWSFEYRVVSRPVGPVRGPITWDDVADEVSTWDAIPAGTTWADLATPDAVIGFGASPFGVSPFGGG